MGRGRGGPDKHGFYVRKEYEAVTAMSAACAGGMGFLSGAISGGAYVGSCGYAFASGLGVAVGAPGVLEAGVGVTSGLVGAVCGGFGTGLFGLGAVGTLGQCNTNEQAGMTVLGGAAGAYTGVTIASGLTIGAGSVVVGAAATTAGAVIGMGMGASIVYNATRLGASD